MDIRRFKKMQPGTQLDYLFNHGVNTGIYLFRKQKQVILFLLADFYVELPIDARRDSYGELKAYSFGKKLEPFLEQIDLSDIYSLLSA